MRKILYVFLGLVLVNSLMFSKGEIDENVVMEAALEPAHVSYVEGVANIGRDSAEINMPVTEGNTVETQNGRVEIKFGRGGCLWLDKNTKVLFMFLGAEAVELEIEYGNVYIQVGTKNIDVFAASEHVLLNQKGINRIEVNGNNVKRFDRLEIVDNFDDFVANRAESATNSNSEYLPAELSEYENELQTNGNWQHHRVYGYVWIPVVSSNWRPYLHGRWIYYPGWGRVWISYDGPWGWVVFHFGRWQYHSNWGWYWIPLTYWSPAWVYWYSWGSYASWCPMWYSSAYYYHYHYYYSHSYSHGWSTVHKNQLSQRGSLSKKIVPKNELKRKFKNEIKLGDLKANTIQGKTQLQKTKARVSDIKTSRIKSRTTARSEFTNTTRSARDIRTYPNRISSTSRSRNRVIESSNSRNIRRKPDTRFSKRYIPKVKNTSRYRTNRINSVISKITSRSRISSITRSASKSASRAKTTARARSTARRVKKK